MEEQRDDQSAADNLSAEEARDAVDEERVDAVGIPESLAESQRAEGLYSVEEEHVSGVAQDAPQSARYQELLDKRRERGLKDEEADELGRLMAEREGQTYSNARSGKHSEAESAPPG